MAAHQARKPPEDELATAVGRWVLGDISLGRAAETVDMTRWELENLLQEVGFTALYGPRSSEELQDEIHVATDLE